MTGILPTQSSQEQRYSPTDCSTRFYTDILNIYDLTLGSKITAGNKRKKKTAQTFRKC